MKIKNRISFLLGVFIFSFVVKIRCIFCASFFFFFETDTDFCGACYAWEGNQVKIKTRAQWKFDCTMPLTLTQTLHWFQARVWLKYLWYDIGLAIVWTGFQSYPLFPDLKCFSSSVFLAWSNDSDCIYSLQIFVAFWLLFLPHVHQFKIFFAVTQWQKVEKLWLVVFLF